MKFYRLVFEDELVLDRVYKEFVEYETGIGSVVGENHLTYEEDGEEGFRLRDVMYVELGTALDDSGKYTIKESLIRQWLSEVKFEFVLRELKLHNGYFYVRDSREMKKVIRIDEFDREVVVEGGETYYRFTKVQSLRRW